MTGDSKHPPEFAHRAPLEYPRWALELIVTLGMALILFIFLLFGMLGGTDTTENQGGEHEIESGLNGL
jgi:hypothetical protein